MAIPKWFQYHTYMQSKLAQCRRDKEFDNNDGKGWHMKDVISHFADSSDIQAYFEDNEIAYTPIAGAWVHWLLYGIDEDLTPNSWFNVEYYYKSKAIQYFTEEGIALDTILNNIDNYASQVKTTTHNRGLTAWSHYIKYGASEHINPSRWFNTYEYVNAKASVMGTSYDSICSTFSSQNMNPIIHCVRFATDPYNNKANEVVAYSDRTHRVLVPPFNMSSDPIFEWHLDYKTQFKQEMTSYPHWTLTYYDSIAVPSVS